MLRGVLLFCFSITTVHAGSEWQHERDVYKKARTALNKKQINQYHKYLAQLTEYPLYQYLVYNEMRMRISKLSDDEVDEFWLNIVMVRWLQDYVWPGCHNYKEKGEQKAF